MKIIAGLVTTAKLKSNILSFYCQLIVYKKPAGYLAKKTAGSMTVIKWCILLMAWGSTVYDYYFCLWYHFINVITLILLLLCKNNNFVILFVCLGQVVYCIITQYLVFSNYIILHLNSSISYLILSLKLKISKLQIGANLTLTEGMVFFISPAT